MIKDFIENNESLLENLFTISFQVNSKFWKMAEGAAVVWCLPGGGRRVYGASYERATADNAGRARQSTSRCTPGAPRAPRPAPPGTRIRHSSVFTSHRTQSRLSLIRWTNETDYPVAYLRQWNAGALFFPISFRDTYNPQLQRRCAVKCMNIDDENRGGRGGQA